MERIQQRPEDPQGYVPVTDFEIFLDEIAKYRSWAARSPDLRLPGLYHASGKESLR